MALTHRIGQTYASNNGTVSSVTTSYTGDGEVVVDATIAAGATNALVNANIRVAGLKSFVFYASTACTVKTNNSTTPGNTLTIPAGGSLIWHTDASYANPLTVDVTALYVTNSNATTAAVFKMTALVDVTP